MLCRHVLFKHKICLFANIIGGGVLRCAPSILFVISCDSKLEIFFSFGVGFFKSTLFYFCLCGSLHVKYKHEPSR